MAWNLLVDMRELFCDALLTDGREAQFFRTFSRKDQPWTSLSEPLGELQNKSTLSDVKVTLSTTWPEVAVSEGWTETVGMIFTEGFEHTLQIGLSCRERPFGLIASKTLPVIPQELCFGITHRIDAKGDIVHELDEKEVEFLATKLKATQCHAVGICLLNSKSNPEQERRLVSLLSNYEIRTFASTEDNGNLYERAHQLAQRIHRTLLTEKITKELGAMGFSPENITIVSPYRVEEHSPTVEILDDGIFINSNQGRIKLRHSLLDEVSLDTANQILIGHEVIGSEPGPVCFGKGLKLCILDLLVQKHSIKSTDVHRLKIDPERLNRVLNLMAKTVKTTIPNLIEQCLSSWTKSLTWEIYQVASQHHRDLREMKVTGWLSHLIDNLQGPLIQFRKDSALKADCSRVEKLFGKSIEPQVRKGGFFGTP
ncbi:MAG: hypothetical protein IT289_11755 [Oligoflexia bacterium]|nr:hypothetical protein [Oligoflexia bacterium]